MIYDQGRGGVMGVKAWWRILDGEEIVASLANMTPGQVAKAMQAGRMAVIDGLGVKPADYVVERIARVKGT